MCSSLRSHICISFFLKKSPQSKSLAVQLLKIRAHATKLHFRNVWAMLIFAHIIYFTVTSYELLHFAVLYKWFVQKSLACDCRCASGSDYPVEPLGHDLVINQGFCYLCGCLNTHAEHVAMQGSYLYSWVISGELVSVAALEVFLLNTLITGWNIS